jgi:hypothetical protein
MHWKDLFGTLKLRKRDNTFEYAIAISDKLEYNHTRTYVCILKEHMDQHRSV